MGGPENLNLEPVSQKFRWQSGNGDWYLKWGWCCGTELLTCGVSPNSGQLVSELNRIVGHPGGVQRTAEPITVGKNTTHLVRSIGSKNSSSCFHVAESECLFMINLNSYKCS